MNEVLSNAMLQLGAIGILISILVYIIRYLLRIEREFRAHLTETNKELINVLERNNKLYIINNTLFKMLVKKIKNINAIDINSEKK